MQEGAEQQVDRVNESVDKPTPIVEEGAGAALHRGTRIDSDSVQSNDTPSPPNCKICFQGPEQGELLNPCRCDGSVRAGTICRQMPWEQLKWGAVYHYGQVEGLAASRRMAANEQTVVGSIRLSVSEVGFGRHLAPFISWTGSDHD
ncbi:hypothetical protein XELAEV_18031465mg [Xenopus laevis]|uniref:RING-CH-type domain-containing protein n=1 Tax=Xenopus laevis TaxID=8355 RepID=A0A974CMP1_XENLA|nr:hypothetical protein XELAEV_18031465mg [Xenopus laevis]